jgi:uncharacterized membrane protein YecN with MAPEG domain
VIQGDTLCVKILPRLAFLSRIHHKLHIAVALAPGWESRARRAVMVVTWALLAARGCAGTATSRCAAAAR